MDGQNSQRKEMDSTMWLSDSSGSRTPDEGSDSTPHTPPSPVAVPVSNQLPIVEPHITMSPTSSPTPSPKKSSRSPKRATTPKSRLGAIDEDTDKVSPDVPLRDPRRLLGSSSKLFSLAFPPTLHGSRRAPRKLWDDVEGPNGEKFSDLRNNQKNADSRRRGWRKYLCIGVILVAIALIVAIILLAVLLTRNRRNNSDTNSGTGDADSASDAFPAGTYRIRSYLTNQSTSCTSNPGTWACAYPQTYAENPAVAPSELSWIISRSEDSKSWVITSQDTIFTYTFTSIPLNLENEGADNEAYVFSYTYSKPVLPTSLSGTSGQTTRCFFDNTVLNGRLFTKMPKQDVGQDASGNPWPYALEFSETISSGTGVPNCYVWVGGQKGDPVTVATGQDGGQCECAYANYNL